MAIQSTPEASCLRRLRAAWPGRRPRAGSASWKPARVLLTLLALAGLLPVSIGWVPMGAMDRLEQSLQDAQWRILPSPEPDPRIAIVEIDAASLAEFGPWPWDDEALARLVDTLLGPQQAALVGFDLVLAPAGLATARLADALHQRPVVLGYACHGLSQPAAPHRVGVLPVPQDLAPPPALPKVPPGNGYLSHPARLAIAAPAAGFLNLRADADGQVRATPLMLEFEGRPHASLALAMLRAIRPEARVDAVTAHVPGGGNLWEAEARFRQLRAADLLAGRLAPGELRGRLVLVGLNASPALGLPAERVAAVAGLPAQVHARLLSGLLDDGLPSAPEGARMYSTAALGVTGAVLAFALPALPAAGAVMLCAAWAALGFWLHTLLLAAGLVLPLAPGLVMVAAALLLNTASAYAAEDSSRRQLAALFGTYAPPELAREMVRDPQRYGVQARSEELTVMFCDVRGFTRLAEQMEPAALQALLNGLFTQLTDTLRAHGATIDKYMGDCIMAFWGAPLPMPEHARRAISAALALVQDMGCINEERRRRGLPAIGLGIGINSGTVCVGDMGSRQRRAYTVIGDAVNLAARLESLSRAYGVAIVAGEATRRLAEGFAWRELDHVQVKGRERALAIYEPLPARLLDDPSVAEELRAWSTFLGAYRAQDWPQCRTLLERLQQRAPSFGLYQLYAGRLEASRYAPADPGRAGVPDRVELPL